MKNYFIIYCILLSYTGAYASDFFRKSTLITTANDTITGSIDFRGEAFLNNDILFKYQTGKTKYFFPDSLECFFFENERIHYASVEYSYMDGGERITKRQFAKRLFSGDLILYKIQFSDIQDDYLYVVEKEGRFSTISRKKDVYNNNTETISTLGINTLAYLFGTNSEAQIKKIKETKYKDSSMIKLFADFNKSADYQDISTEVETCSKMKTIEPLINVSYIHADFLKSSVGLESYSISLLCEFSDPQFSNKSSVIAGIGYTIYDYDKYFDDYIHEYYPEYEQVLSSKNRYKYKLHERSYVRLDGIYNYNLLKKINYQLRISLGVNFQVNIPEWKRNYFLLNFGVNYRHKKIGIGAMLEFDFPPDASLFYNSFLRYYF